MTTPRRPSHLRLLSLGFKPGGLMSRGPLYHKAVGTQVWFINRVDVTAGRFTLTASEMRAFLGGRLSLVPRGCCNPSGGRSKEGETEATIKDAIRA